MNLSLKRTKYDSTGVWGELYNESKVIIAYTLEHAYLDEKGTVYSKIPNGTYICIRGPHRLHNMTEDFITFEIDVPNHTNILFHVGNYNRDSDGCLLLGESIGKDMLLRSKVAFTNFMHIQADVESFTLTVS